MASLGTVDHAISDLYRITLRVRNQTGGSGPVIRAYMPKEFTLSLSANWESPFSSGFNSPEAAVDKAGNAKNGIIDTTISNVANALGGLIGRSIRTNVDNVKKLSKFTTLNTQPKIVSRLAYTGPTHLDIMIPFVFVADKDPYSEVTKPVQELLKLTAARTKAYMMLPPGPLLDNTGEDISLEIGSSFRFEEIVVTNVSAQQDIRFDKNGNCMQSRVDVSFRTVYAVDRDYIEGMFTVKE